MVRVWLDCPKTKDGGLVGFVQVNRVLSGYEPAEDSIRCHGDARSPTLHSCDTRHGMTIVNARATCPPERCNSEEEARRLMARVVELVATLPEQPCRLCPRYFSPQRRAELTKLFSGTGPKQLGTIEVEVDSRIRYVVVPRGGIRIMTGRPPQVLVEDAHHQGQADIARGTYRKVKVSSSGESWHLLIEPR